eukprot:jgi/Botrbrau1/9359/Bobra.354_2s0016.1
MSSGAGKRSGQGAGQAETHGESETPQNGTDKAQPISPLRNQGSPESPPTAPNVDRLSSPRPSAFSGAPAHARRGEAQNDSRSANPKAGAEKDAPNSSVAKGTKPRRGESKKKAVPSPASSSGAERCGTPERTGATRQSLGAGPGHSAGSQSSPCNGHVRAPGSGVSGSAGASGQAPDERGPPAGPKGAAMRGNPRNGRKLKKRTRFGAAASKLKPVEEEEQEPAALEEGQEEPTGAAAADTPPLAAEEAPEEAAEEEKEAEAPPPKRRKGRPPLSEEEKALRQHLRAVKKAEQQAARQAYALLNPKRGKKGRGPAAVRRAAVASAAAAAVGEVQGVEQQTERVAPPPAPAPLVTPGIMDQIFTGPFGRISVFCKEKAGLYDPVQMRVAVHSLGRPNSDEPLSREMLLTGAQFVRLAHGLPEPPLLEMMGGNGVADGPPPKEPSWKLTVKVANPSGGTSMSLAEWLASAYAQVLSPGGCARAVSLACLRPGQLPPSAQIHGGAAGCRGGTAPLHGPG